MYRNELNLQNQNNALQSELGQLNNQFSNFQQDSKSGSIRPTSNVPTFLNTSHYFGGGGRGGSGGGQRR
jgi:hypothetical protein